jgi:hypothetical protein
MLHSISLNSQNRYEIQVYGQLDESWLDLFDQAKVHSEILADNSQVTRLSDLVMDQAGLVGLIRRLHGHGIVLISIVGHGDPAISKETQND